MGPDFSDVQTFRIQIISIALSILFIGAIVELIRRGKLREEYSFVWFAASLVFFYFSIFRGHLDALAHRLGIAYAPALLILIVLFFGSVLAIHFSIVVSKLTNENKRLAQEQAILGRRLEEFQAESTNWDD